MSNEIIKLDRIDATFTQKNRVIKAVEDMSHSHQSGRCYGIVAEAAHTKNRQDSLC